MHGQRLAETRFNLLAERHNLWKITLYTHNTAKILLYFE